MKTSLKSCITSAFLSCVLFTYESTAQITQTADICPGACSSNLAWPKQFNGNVYFQASTSTSGAELWVYDGNNPPTMVLDINPGAANSSPGDFLIYDDKLYFSADDGTNGRQLWVYDGTNPPSMVHNFGANFTNFDVLQSTLYVLADNRVWSYAGTGTPSVVANLGTFSITGGTILGATGTNIYFTASTAAAGTEVWRYTGSGLPSVMDINPGSGSSVVTSTAIAVGNNFYFFADNGTNGAELWVHTGTGSPSMVADINPSGTGSMGIGGIANLNGTLYFQATDGTNGTELWQYDGTNPPSMRSNINPGSGSSNPVWFTVINNVLYFSANDGTHGAELWHYNGSSDPEMIQDVATGSESFSPAHIFGFNDKIYMRGDGDNGEGAELWEYTPIPPDTDAPEVSFDPAHNSTDVALSVAPTITFNEAIRLINNDPIDNTNVDDLVELKLNNSEGADVAFDAVINNDNEIVITPSSALLSGQVYYVALKANVVEDHSDNAITTVESASFTTENISTGINTGLSEIYYNIYPNPVVSGMEMHVKSDKLIDQIRITNALGTEIYRGTELKSIAQPGLYYVELEIENKIIVQKIIVQ